MDLDFEMDRIRKYARENNISISDSCMLHATAAKMNFYEEAINKIQSKYEERLFFSYILLISNKIYIQNTYKIASPR